MLGIVIFFTAFVSILSSAIGSGDIDSFLKNILSQNARASTSEDSSSSSSSNDAKGSLVDQLRQMDLGKLVRIANQLKVLQKEENSQSLWKPTTARFNLIKNKVLERQDAGRYGATEHLIQQLLHRDHKPSKYSHKQLFPNSLLRPFKLHQNDGWERTALSDYSKIYIVMDPETLRNSVNQDTGSSWLSRILEQTVSAAQKASEKRNKETWYKGFMVKDDVKSRRYRRDSKEMYGGGGGSMEDEYKPKRQRSEHVGGGKGGGRTAIPYIRHRGDIYERDH